MAFALDKLAAWNRFWAPKGEEFTGDPEMVRQSDLSSTVGLILFSAAAFYGLVYIALSMWLTAFGVYFAVGLILSALVVRRRGASISTAGHLYGAAVTSAIGTILVGTGGHVSPASAWFALGPMLAMMVGGRAVGLRWMLPALGLLVSLHAVSWMGWLPPSESPEWFVTPYLLIGPVGLTICLIGIAFSYESNRDRAMSEVKKAQLAAETARDQARLVLDNVSQGLVMVRPDGTLEGARSLAADALVGPVQEGQPVWEWLQSIDETAAMWLEMGWEELSSPWMPLELALEQLPSRVTAGAKTLDLSYQVLGAGEEMTGALLVLTDVTAQVVAQEAESANRELMEVFQFSRRDPNGLSEFLLEAREMVERIVAGGGSAVEEKRWVHTLKGSGALVGLVGLASWLHGLEDELNDRGERLTEEERQQIAVRWAQTEGRLAPLLGEADERRLIVDVEDWERAITMLEQGLGADDVAEFLRQWSWDRVDSRLERLAERTRAMAGRLGKSHVEVHVAADAVRTPPDVRWRSLYSSLVHAVRNSLDHGLESEQDRSESGKNEQARLQLVASADGGELVLRIEDDGRGIDWERLSEKAASLGMNVEDPAEVLFLDGLSSKDAATEVSGRGVGMGALREATEALGGRVTVRSQQGQGTVVELVMPT